MARRATLLAGLAVLAYAAAALHRSNAYSSEDSDSASYDSFVLFDDYDDSFETTPLPRPITKTPSSKVILRGQKPKVNVSLKNTKSENKKNVYKTTNIKIESHTNFIVTKKPLTNVVTKVPQQPVMHVEEQYVWLDDDGEQIILGSHKPTSGRPPTATRPVAIRRPSTTRRSTTTRRPVTTRRRPLTGSTPRPWRLTSPKTTKTQNNKKTTCPPKKSGLLASYFQDNTSKKTSKKPTNSSWFTSFISRIYKWISKSIWPTSWFEQSSPEKSSTKPPTTTSPPTTTVKNWYQSLLDSEESDGDYVTEINTKKKVPPKNPTKKNYKGYKLLRAFPDVKKKVQDMLDLREEGQGSGLMWWTPPSLNSSTDLLVPPDLLADVKDYLKTSKIDYDVIIWDLQESGPVVWAGRCCDKLPSMPGVTYKLLWKAIIYENPNLSRKQRLELERDNGHPMTWRRYHRYADILRYLEYLQHSYAELVELVPMGRSSEGLPLVAVKVSLPMNETQKRDSDQTNKKWKLRSRMKPAVWLDGGAHAREWIAPAVATWMLRALVEGQKGLGADYKVLEQADFYIMPVMNPDGYEHSHTHDRLWRKTRSRQPDQSDEYFTGWFDWWKRGDCVGVDADRNWDYNWGKQDSSQDPCEDNYAGLHPFSEPETRAVSNFLTEHKREIKVYISLHAYTQAWIVPSFEGNSLYGNDGELMEMGELATAALADLYNTKYQVGTVAQIRQPASGMSHDWAKARAGIPFSYHVDLRDSLGPYGFLLPGAKIESTAHETWMAVKAIVDNLITV